MDSLLVSFLVCLTTHRTEMYENMQINCYACIIN